MDLPAWAKVNGDGSVTVTLTRAIEIDGVSRADVTLREPSVRDSLAIRKMADDAEREVALLGNLAEVERDALLGLRMKDYGRLQDVLRFFQDPD